MTVRLTLLVPDDLRKQAKAVAALRGESISEVVREALEDYVTAATTEDEDVEAAVAAYRRYKQDPDSARPYSEIRKELVAEGLLSE